MHDISLLLADIKTQHNKIGQVISLVFVRNTITEVNSSHHNYDWGRGSCTKRFIAAFPPTTEVYYIVSTKSFVTEKTVATF